MIKRRFYKLEHGDRDAPSESSSSSDSEFETEATEDDDDEEEEDNETKEEDDGVARLTGGNESSSGETLSGYESEDCSANEVNLDSSGLPTSDEDVTTLKDTMFSGKAYSSEKVIAESDNMQNNSMPGEDEIPSVASDYVLKCKSVYKCRLCPRIVCLTVQTLIAHLKSKRHARSEKLLKEGRLKLMLTEDGKIEGEIHPEEDSPIGGQNPSASKKKSKGLKRQLKERKFKKNKENFLPVENTVESRKNHSRKRQKNK